jgi:type II secretory pathway component PulM
MNTIRLPLLHESRRALATRWQAMSRNGQRATAVALVLLAATLVWAFVYQPLQQSRERSARSIAKLNADFAAMQRDAAALTALRTTAPVAAAAPSRAADVASLQGALGPRTTVSIAPPKDAVRVLSFRVVITDQPYVDWLDRTAAATRQYRLAIAGLTLTRNGDKVSGNMLLTEVR